MIRGLIKTANFLLQKIISDKMGTNTPKVASMKLPSCIMKDFVIMPTISFVNSSIDHCKFSWYRQISSLEKEKYIKEGTCLDTDIIIEKRMKKYWYKICDGLIFCPKLEDVAHYIKVVCIPSDGVKDGRESVSISSTPVELGPSYCPFEKRHKFTEEKTKDPKKFRFMTYNLLADLYADSDHSRTVLFGHCPSHALDINYRRQLILKEILGYNADIYCLQEVDRKEFDRTYKPFFRFVGNYTGIFDRKGGSVAEGEATFFRDDKFVLVDTHKALLSNLIDTNGIEDKPSYFIHSSVDSTEAQECLSRLNNIRKAIFAKPELKKRFCDRNTIIQASLLKFKETQNDYLLVANTHLYFAPDADHIRLLQGSVCVKYLEYVKEYYRDHYFRNTTGDQCCKPNIYTMFAGDLNSTPECGLFKLLTQGKIDGDLPDWSSAGEEESVPNLEVSTNLRFSSAYQNIDYTNYTPEFNGCLDYIYYENDYIHCKSTVPLPDHKDITAIGGIPSDVFPSDHLALIADFEI